MRNLRFVLFWVLVGMGLNVGGAWAWHWYTAPPAPPSERAEWLIRSLDSGDDWRLSEFGNGVVNERAGLFVEILPPNSLFIHNKRTEVVVRSWNNGKTTKAPTVQQVDGSVQVTYSYSSTEVRSWPVGTAVGWYTDNDLRNIVVHAVELETRLLHNKLD